MPTFVSMLNWTGTPAPMPDDVGEAIAGRTYELRGAGMHSVVFLPEQGDCAAIMIATCADEDGLGRLAASILPGARVHIESMEFDGDSKMPAWIGREGVPPPPGGYLGALYEAVAR
jgi:hypothetical protein